jgi:hypothetical protein
MRPTPHSNPIAEWALQHLPDWWERIDKDENWRFYSFVGLAVAYGIIAIVAFVQLIRIQLRVPEYGWTTQKVTSPALQRMVSVPSMRRHVAWGQSET